MANEPCPLCAKPLKYYRFQLPDIRDVECWRCGAFSITGIAIDKLKEDQKHLLSATIRARGEPLPLIKSDDLSMLITQAPQLTVQQKMDRLLELIAEKTSRLGDLSTFDWSLDYPLLVARDPDEVTFMVRALGEKELIDTRQIEQTRYAALTIEGWHRVDQMRSAGPRSAFAFVAMWFDPGISDLYDKTIHPAIRDAGYEPIRVDRRETLHKIDDEIIGEMRRSRFMVADFTGQRQSVYFEAGFMRGLGRNVIWMCSKEEIDQHKVHFDIRQYPFIGWETPEDARERLYKRILANEGEGPRRAS